MYLSKAFYEKHEQLEPVKDIVPDLFILTDYANEKYFDYRANHGWNNGRWAYEECIKKLYDGTVTPNDVLVRDANTRIVVLKAYPIKLSPLDCFTELTSFDIPNNYGSGMLMQVRVESESNSHPNSNKGLGTFTVDVLYLYAENAAFTADVLIKNNIKVDSIVRVRYGVSFGGSKGVSGEWLRYLADVLDVKYYVSNEFGDDTVFSGDELALKLIKTKTDRQVDFKKASLCSIYERGWYEGERVHWYLVEKR